MTNHRWGSLVREVPSRKKLALFGGHVGDYEGLKQRLCQKLGTGPTKTSSKISLAALDRPYSKGAIWQIPEKDLLVELREIHETHCDLIISSISLLKAKEEGNKAAQTSASAGF